MTATEVDVVVVGSGAAGLAAALTAHQEGLVVLIVEKTDRIGGTSAISGGTIWIPLSEQATASGQDDDMDRVRRYLDQVIGPQRDDRQLQTFLTAGPEALRYLERYTEAKFVLRERSPDYHPEKPGAALGGRSLDVIEFDGRELGRGRFRELRDPLVPFMVLGGMMVNMLDVHHLLRASRSFVSWQHGMKLVLRFAADRLMGYHRGTRLVLGNALVARLFKSVLDRQIAYWLNAPAKSLTFDGGSANGVTVCREGREQRISARQGVVLASGGFPWHERLRSTYLPKPTGPWSMAPEGNQGDGITMALSAGATLGSQYNDPAYWAPMSVHVGPDGSFQRYVHFAWDRAKAGLIAVNKAGRRFVNEATSYHSFVRAMYRSESEFSAIPCFLICDSRFMGRWGLGLALPGGRRRDHLIRDGYLLKAQSLLELADLAEIDANGLVQTVARVNQFAALGEDPDFGKGCNAYNRHLGDADHKPNPCVGSVTRAPFFAIKIYPGDIGTALGILVDAHARALDREGNTIPGLYIVGNDMHSVMGGEYPSAGITLGPALTFGWLAGIHLGEKARQMAK